MWSEKEMCALQFLSEHRQNDQQILLFYYYLQTSSDQ